MAKKRSYFFESISSKTFWQYVFLSKTGIMSILSIFGTLFLFIETLDFFGIYTRDKYASYTYLIVLALSIIISVASLRPVKTITIKLPQYDISIEVRIGNLFDVSGAIMISTNNIFEADVAGGKIDPNSLQGQFTARYFTGNQVALVKEINEKLKSLEGSIPYPMGTTIPILTHGKSFYFTSMAELNEQGNASTTIDNIKLALNGLWNFIREKGELQELGIPVIGTGRGRLKQSRKKIIATIAESFVKASEEAKITDKLVIVVHPDDAQKFGVNLYEIKDNLKQVLFP
jgi:hypothetical protein